MAFCFEIPFDEVEGLELRTDRRLVVARNARLDSYWGNVGGFDEQYVLLIGGQIGILGPENQLEIQVTDAELQAIIASTRQKLISAGFDGEPQLHILWEQDV